MQGPTTTQRALVYLPFLAGLVWLAIPLVGDRSPDFDMAELFVGPALGLGLLLSMPLLALRALHAADAEERRRRMDFALLLPCALAPLLVATPWALVASHLGIGFGSFPFFLSSLDRYPNLGPINYEVLLGIGAVLGSSAVPVLLAAHAWLGHAARPWVVASLAVAQLVAYLPVLFHLDLGLLSFSIHGFDEEVWAVAVYGTGPVVRFVATATMITYAVVTFRRERPGAQPVWEL